jgi:Sporulation lipoprotein YhcN/YlaJ (Spore_YhcN_YlaJ)
MKKACLFLMVFFLGVFGCNGTAEQSQSLNVTRTGFQQKKSPIPVYDQSPSKKAEEIAKKMEEITEVMAVNSDKELLVVFKMKHLQRFRLKKIENTVNKKLNKAFPDHKVTVSSDLKIYLETSKLKDKMKREKLSKKELSKKIEKITKLSNEQT